MFMSVAASACQRCTRRGMAACTSVRAGRGEILEAGVFAKEREAYGADGSVALLADDDLRRALVLCVGVVDLVAVDEQDYVSILFDRPRVVTHDAIGEP